MCRRGVSDVPSAVVTSSNTSLAQLRPLRAIAVRGVVDIDHADQDVATLLATVRVSFHRRASCRSTPLRQAARSTRSTTPASRRRADASAFTKLAHPRRASPEVTRLLRLWSRVTPRQRAVMANLAVGRDNRSIAHELGVGERAVKAHVSALLAMFGLDHRTELALMAAGAGLQPERH